MSNAKVQHEGRELIRAQIPRALLRDRRLSFGARGLFAFLWDLPSGWEIRLAHLATLGPDGRDAVRARLRELEKVGAIRIEEERRDDGTISGKAWIMVNPDRWAIESSLLAKKDNEIKLNSDIPISGDTQIGKSDAKVLQESKVLQEEAAHAPARGPVGAAVHAGGKIYNRRASGIITWLPADVQAAESIEQHHSADDIAAAIAALAAAGKQPVPGLVAQKIEQLHRDRKAADSRAAIDAQLRIRDQADIDPAVIAKNAHRLPAALRAKIPQTTTTQEATS